MNKILISILFNFLLHINNKQIIINNAINIRLEKEKQSKIGELDQTKRVGLNPNELDYTTILSSNLFRKPLCLVIFK